MSLNLNGEKCAVCSAYLFDDDDTVYCPICGAPHHRDCYNSIGQCGLKELHGTDAQYKRPQQSTKQTVESADNNVVVCGMCGEKYSPEETACPNCNTPNILKAGGKFISFDFLGGVPDDTDLGEGVTADEAKKFVFNNSHRYIPKFFKFKNGKKASWNWLAFLTPCGWLMSRKMYILGGIIGALQIALSLLTAPYAAALNTINTDDVQNYLEYANLLLENIQIIGKVAIYSAFVALVLNSVIRIVIAIFGDFIYRNRVIKKIGEIKKQSLDKTVEYRKKGGINIWTALLGYLSVSYLPSLIANMLGIL